MCVPLTSVRENAIHIGSEANLPTVADAVPPLKTSPASVRTARQIRGMRRHELPMSHASTSRSQRLRRRPVHDCSYRTITLRTTVSTCWPHVEKTLTGPRNVSPLAAGRSSQRWNRTEEYEPGEMAVSKESDWVASITSEPRAKHCTPSQSGAFHVSVPTPTDVGTTPMSLRRSRTSADAPAMSLTVR